MERPATDWKDLNSPQAILALTNPSKQAPAIVTATVAGCRSLRPLWSGQRRFAPIATGIAPEQVTGIKSESVTAFIGIRSTWKGEGYMNKNR